MSETANRAGTRDFWRSSGYHLLARGTRGWLEPTPEFVRAYLARPELRPVEESCDAEVALFDALMADPHRAVPEAELSAIADEAARENYRIVLRFRDHLVSKGTLEAAYLDIVGSDRVVLPPLFVDQMAHAILRGILADCGDPMRLRAGEMFFRSQNVGLDEGRIMLADEEVVEMYAETGGMGGLGQLVVESMTPLRRVELDVLDEDNKHIYWDRSDRFDTVVDFRFTQPAVDALARVMEAWVRHFLGVIVRIQPMQAIRDERWRWHVGLDAEATRILNALYDGADPGLDDMERILALFTLEIRDEKAAIPDMRGRPVYLGLAMSPDRKLRMKPQNLLTNLPLVRAV
jgi:hypothetical protein